MSKSLDIIKSLLCSKPVLKFFDPDLQIDIYIDACLIGVRAELQQKEKMELINQKLTFQKMY